MGALGIPDGVLHRAASVAREFGVQATELLTGRAALRGLSPRGQLSAGGASRLLPAADGWFALTLSREDDVAAVPALIGADAVDDVWGDLARWAVPRRAQDVVARARLLGLPAARLGEAGAAKPRVQDCGPRAGRDEILVADLTSMWAGPLCGQLLARTGAVVVKVESPTRPDGTRRGDPAFFDWMNGGKLSYAIDFDQDRAKLMRLLGAADVVLEGSRRSALARRALGPSDLPARPGRVWVRITGYGSDEGGDWAAFGDDAAVAGGLVGYCGDTPEFIGDAIADPLTGLTAAGAVRAALRRGGGELIEIALAGVAAGYAAGPATPATDDVPMRPVITGTASALGADNAIVEELVGRRC